MPTNLWSDTEIRLLKKYYPKTTPKKIMELLPDRSYWSINIKASRLRIKKLPETLSKVRAVFIGRHHTEETKAKISQAQRGVPQPEEFRQRLRGIMKGEGNPFYARHHSQKTKTLISEKLAGRHNSPENEFTTERAKKIWTTEARETQSAVMKARWQSKEYVEKLISSLIKSLAKRPNKLEEKVIKILNTAFPNEWEYTGNGKVVLDKLIPDFVNSNGKKQVIEVFGEYWHTGDRIKNRIERTEQGRINAYKKLGYDCFVLWEKDIEDEQKVVRLVKNFMEA